MILLISYDLNRHERPSAYEKIRSIIEKNAEDAVKPMYSQWLVKTSLTCDAWMELLQPDIDGNDRVLIVRVQLPYQGWLDPEHWDWLNSQ